MRSLVTMLAAVGLMLAAAGTAVALTPEEQAEGFVALFDGKTLEGWDGDLRLWSVQEGVIRGQTTPENPAKGNTFIVWRGGKVKDFVLKIQFRIQNGNSGIQYRSKEVSKWVMSGYQAEVEDTPGKVGFLYHEKGRAYLARVGDFVVIDDAGKNAIVSKVADVEDLKAKTYYKKQDWNEYIIIAQGNYIRHYLNGYPTIALIDGDRLTDPADPKDTKGAAREGLLALQIHAGPPMIVEFKDIRIKNLTSNYGKAVRLFNGENFDGWTVPFENLKEANTFTVKDGLLDDTGKPAGYIRTTDDFTNYTFHLQMRHLAKGNSGVLVRMVGDDKVWPKSIEAQGMSDNMGDIFNIDNVKMTSDPDRTKGRRIQKMHESNERPMGEWNDYEVTLDGGDLVIKINNLVQNTATECEEVGGKICIQAEGSQKQFRNIVLVPIEK